MGISLKTHKLLWGRSGNKCAFEQCRHDLIADETETDDESIIGDEAHIVAKKIDGPRGDYPLPMDKRDHYDNLILLCRIHHKMIDDQPKHYTVEKLHEIKANHEEWVSDTLSTNKQLKKDELMYSSYLDELFVMMDLENYNNWSMSLICNGQPSIGLKRLEILRKVPNFIVSRFWPKRYEDLELAVYNLKNVLNDLLAVFQKHIDKDSIIGEDSDDYEQEVWTKKIYKIKDWNPDLYSKMSKEFEYHVDLVMDLTFELTRAMNFLIEKVREFLNPKFREEEGKLLLTSGPMPDLSYHTYKVEYRMDEKAHQHPYPGLKKFMTERAGRDYCIGEGYNSNYFLNGM